MAQYNLRGMKDIPLSTESTTETCSTKMAADAGESGKLSLEMVLSAIRESKEELSTQMNIKTTTIRSSLTKVETALSTLADQVEEMEGRISANEDNIRDATTHVEKLEKEVKFLKEKVDDLGPHVQRLA